MNLSPLLLLSLAPVACDKPSGMQLPAHHALDCPPFGMHTVEFHRQEDEPQYNLPGVSEATAALAVKEVIANWPTVWNAAKSKFENLLADYEYEKNLQELLAEPQNSLNVLIVVPESNERFRLEVFIDVGFKLGSHVFGVEFIELSAQDAHATF
jgi:hypothetical protein